MSAAPALVPSANRGLKVLSPSLSQSLEIAHIDFMTFTFNFKMLAGQYGASIESVYNQLFAESESINEEVRERLIRLIFTHFFDETADGIKLELQLGGFRNFYENHIKIITNYGDMCGFIALGGSRQKGSVCIELTGLACTHVTAWGRLRGLVDDVKGKISRVDIAHDDYAGTYNLDDAVRWYERGDFTNGGRPPAIEHRGWNDDSGRTLYIGKNTGNQQLCVYEKGKQSGDPSSKWIRWEGRFGSKYREIPLEILENPAAYLLGHYPALFWIEAKASKMKTSMLKASATITSAMSHLKRQYGALLHLLSSHIQADTHLLQLVFKSIQRDRLPRWALPTPESQQAFLEHIHAISINKHS